MREKLNPYFKLFHGERVWREEIDQEDVFVNEICDIREKWRENRM